MYEIHAGTGISYCIVDDDAFGSYIAACEWLLSANYLQESACVRLYDKDGTLLSTFARRQRLCLSQRCNG